MASGNDCEARQCYVVERCIFVSEQEAPAACARESGSCCNAHNKDNCKTVSEPEMLLMMVRYLCNADKSQGVCRAFMHSAHIKSSPDIFVHERLNHVAPNSPVHRVAKQILHSLEKGLHAPQSRTAHCCSKACQAVSE